MERLTEEKQLGPFASLKDKAEAVPGAFGTYDCLYAHMVAVTRLKAYEDTGLEPKEIAEVQEAMNPIPFGRFHDIKEAVQQRCMDADWEPATNTATAPPLRGLLQRIGQAWRVLLS